MLGCEDGTFLVSLDLSKVPELGIQGQEGILGTGNNGSYQPFDQKYEGSWDYVFFKYVHSPDPELRFLVREWNLLRTMGVISPQNLISFDDWEAMKFLKTMTPPSELRISK